MPGVWRAVVNCYGIVVIFHSPLACAHVARSLEINSYYRILSESIAKSADTVPLVSSELEEKHTIFGGAERLKKCIENVVKKYTPKCIVIANSCVAGVIGDDVDSVAKDAEKKWQVPVISVSTYGFLDGEYYGGYFETAEKIAGRFFKKSPKVKNTAVLLGDNDGPHGKYAAEVTRLLSLLGIRVICQFPGYTRFEDFPKVTQGEGLIVLGHRGENSRRFEQFAEKLHQKFEFSYIPDTYPLGWEQTKKWIINMGIMFSCQEKAQILLDNEEIALNMFLGKVVPEVQGKKVMLCIGRWLNYFNPDFILEIIDLMKLDLAGIVILTGHSEKMREKMIEEIYKYNPKAVIYDEQCSDILFKQVELIITTHELNSNNKQLFIPMLPKAGRNGVMDIMTEIYRSLCSKKENGGIVYV